MPDRLSEAALEGRDAAAGRAAAGNPAAPAARPDARLLALADQCVLCGLCLPHCPTYRIGPVEAESPRGRIALARALTEGRIEADAAAVRHLDQCLDCRSCEKVCPSGVRYGQILTRARAELRSRRKSASALDRLLRDPRRLVALARLGAALRAERWLPALSGFLPRAWHAAVKRIPSAPSARAMGHRPARAHAASRGRVVLFPGCVASVYDRDTLAAAARVLTALGYEPVAPRGTTCCGALARHAGDLDSADRLSSQARASIAEAGGTAVLVSASGCFDDLREYACVDGTPVRDISEFIAQDDRFATLRLRPLALRAALHLPCTQVNLVGATDAIRTLIARIPGLAITELPEQPRCCGAAGSYFIEHPDIADRLRDEKLDQALANPPDVIVTTNIGCRIHLANGLRDRAPQVPVLHPLALLARQLEN